jgi:TolA-binding protein
MSGLDPSLDIDMLIVAGVAGLFSAGAMISSIRARREQTRLRREQTRLDREKTEDEVFVRIQTMYTTALKTQESQLTIANDRIAEQNKKIHELEMQNGLLENRIEELLRGNPRLFQVGAPLDGPESFRRRFEL